MIEADRRTINVNSDPLAPAIFSRGNVVPSDRSQILIYTGARACVNFLRDARTQLLYVCVPIFVWGVCVVDTSMYDVGDGEKIMAFIYDAQQEGRCRVGVFSASEFRARVLLRCVLQDTLFWASDVFLSYFVK